MRAHLVAIAVLATALAVCLGLVQPPVVLKEASEIVASVKVRDLKKEMSLLVGGTENARR
jgi:hypothetical protein